MRSGRYPVGYLKIVRDTPVFGETLAARITACGSNYLIIDYLMINAWLKFCMVNETSVRKGLLYISGITVCCPFSGCLCWVFG